MKLLAHIVVVLVLASGTTRWHAVGSCQNCTRKSRPAERIVCRRKQSGNSHVARVQTRCITLEMTHRRWSPMHGLTETEITGLIAWGRSNRMILVCMTCTGTCGSGVRTDRILITMSAPLKEPIPLELRLRLSRYTGVAAG
jgi:hypothetical protein